jgi:hypothetical protein
MRVCSDKSFEELAQALQFRAERGGICRHTAQMRPVQDVKIGERLHLDILDTQVVRLPGETDPEA